MENYIQQIQCLFLKYGIKSVSMDDVARELSISKKTLYKHFTTKSEMVMQVMQNHLELERKIVLEITSNAENAMEELIQINRALCQHVNNINPSMIYDLKKYHPKAMQLMEDYKYSEILNHIIENISSGRKEGLYRNDFDPKIIALLYVAHFDTVIESSKFTELNITEVAEHSIFYHLHGIASLKGIETLQTLKKINNEIPA